MIFCGFHLKQPFCEYDAKPNCAQTSQHNNVVLFSDNGVRRSIAEVRQYEMATLLNRACHHLRIAHR